MSCLAGEEIEERWSHYLCCVYTHVEITEDATPYLETYDGTIHYMASCDDSGAAKVMETAMDEICDMPMGKVDCRKSGKCKAKFDY